MKHLMFYQILTTLCSHNESFPGTILECKLYLNKDFLNNNEQY